MKYYTIEQVQTMQTFAQEANDFMVHSWSSTAISDGPIYEWLERAQSLPISFNAIDFHEFCEEEAVNYEEFWQFYLAYQIQQCQSIAKQYHETLQQLRTRNKIAGMRARACRQTVQLGG